MVAYFYLRLEYNLLRDKVMNKKVQGVNHIAIAVPDLDQAESLWCDKLGLRKGKREIIESEGGEVQMIFAGDTRIELVSPLSEDSPIAKYLSKNGPGLHHIAFQVDNCAEMIEHCLDNDIKLVNEEVRVGAHETKIAFTHPKSTSGVLCEWVETGE